MKQNNVCIHFLLMIMSERMFIFVRAFLFGYCHGYYLFELMKYKNRNYEIPEIFLSCNKKYGMQCKLSDENVGRDIFLEKDLSYVEIFLNNVIKDCEVYYYLNKKHMTICYESQTMTETIARKLLKMVDWLMDEHFFKKNGLRELGWCSNYMLDKRSVNYCKDQQVFKKTEIVEFY